jgi:pyridoxamine 5'-phosphate oxidase
MSLADLRRDYTLAGLRRSDLLQNPIEQFIKWFNEALNGGVLEPNAMTLATADKLGRPSSRTVLLKGVDERGFTFFTNYESRKGRELAENQHCALTIHWRELERQICICGTTSRVSRQESAIYFKSRPVLSQLGAWISKQSEAIPDRKTLEAEFEKIKERFPNNDVPLPPHWGGFLVSPLTIEFWQGRPSRLHDRFLYTKNESAVSWKIDRLSP